MNALEKYAPERVTVEFLRPPTFDHLIERLEDQNLPAVDILHFDGHGLFGSIRRLQDESRQPATRHNGQANELLRKAVPETGANTGYLYFENEQGNTDPVSAQLLGEMLQRQNVSLVVLSACQSAAFGESEEPMGSVAVRLTGTGIPNVLAMTHSVLVTTTELLFGDFYRHLARGEGVGEALDNARRFLMRHPEKHEVQRGPHRVRLKLHDWFLPALYQTGDDVPLLQRTTTGSTEASAGLRARDNLPKLQEAGFFGRRRELWNIERWFVDATRRISIAGFGGQGKTYLAVEAGRWLLRTDMFERAVFVDYAAFQGIDAVGLAISVINAVFGESFPTADSVAAALCRTRTLLILDNLEALDKPGFEASGAAAKFERVPSPLQDLLGVAKVWSESGESRVLTTSRTSDFQHPDYPFDGSKIHRGIQLRGLWPEDALRFFESLTGLPPAPTVPALPARKALLELFDLVDFHPLSIALLAQQLKTRRPAELGDRLEVLLAQSENDKDKSLAASLQLSLDKLTTESLRWLKRLGVFRGGAFEEHLLKITEIPKAIWSDLRTRLQSASLIGLEFFVAEGIRDPYVKFHPTLAPLLWLQLSAAERDELIDAHLNGYYLVSEWLFNNHLQLQDATRMIARCELPNLLHAVNVALNRQENFATAFVQYVRLFLTYFGLNGDDDVLLKRSLAGIVGERGSQSWYRALSNKGDQLLNSGRAIEAADIFQEVVNGLGETSKYERCVVLNMLGRCRKDQGRFDLAVQAYRSALAEAEALPPTLALRRERASLLTNLGTILTHTRQFDEARTAYETALAVATEIDDARSVGVIEGQLGSLALAQGRLEEAVRRYAHALAIFQRLDEPGPQAIAWFQLGAVFEEGQNYNEAEKHYREAARIDEFAGNIAGAADAWHQLGLICAKNGKPEAAESWYNKAIDVARNTRNYVSLGMRLNNLALVLMDQPGRLLQAKRNAEESLTIKRDLDPYATRIWNTYQTLAKICAKQNDAAGAQGYQRLAVATYTRFVGARTSRPANDT
jgi:tetratricopeptide (TPR) repeat protein